MHSVLLSSHLSFIWQLHRWVNDIFSIGRNLQIIFNLDTGKNTWIEKEWISKWKWKPYFQNFYCLLFPVSLPAAAHLAKYLLWTRGSKWGSKGGRSYMPRYADIQRRYTEEDVEDVHQTCKRCLTIITYEAIFENFW